MGNMKDLTGQKFEMWTVLEVYGKNKSGGYMWLCQCDCGKIKAIDGRSLRSGTSKSCGCGRSVYGDLYGHGKHNGRNDRLYAVWVGIKDRCLNSNSKFYHRYGGRGITICDEWKDDYPAFKEWAYSHGYNDQAPKGECTIDRINNDEGYSPENCRFTTSMEQCNNRSNNHRVEYNGEEHTIAEWCRITGIPKYTLLYRINRYGWDIEKALTTPVGK